MTKSACFGGGSNGGGQFEKIVLAVKNGIAPNAEAETSTRSL